MSEPMDRREVFEPEKVATYTHSVFGGYAPFVSLEDYQRLLAANREKDAEIERLKSQLAATDHVLKHDCSRALVALAGAHVGTPAETYGVNTSWAISDLCRTVTKQAEELASLRASGGEKPEDAWRRAWSVGYFDALNNVDVLRPAPYVAPPTLTREKE